MQEDGAAFRQDLTAPAGAAAAGAAVRRMIAAGPKNRAGAFRAVLCGRRSSDAFWAEDPAVLFKTLAFFPRAGMTESEIANAFTRCVVVGAAALFALGVERWWAFLVAGVAVAVAFWVATVWSRRKA